MKKINKLKLIELINDGLTNKEISLILNVSRATVVRSKTFYNLRSKSALKKHEAKKCLNCEKEFDSLKNEKRKFCCSKCSGKFTNNQRKIVKKCLNCKTTINVNGYTIKKFCSTKCHKEFEEKIRFNKIENNEKVGNRTLKLYLIKKYGNKCMECGWCEVNKKSGKVPIELEHIDGNSDNNNLQNLKLLCPNCHSLTPTYKALNSGNGRYSRRKRYSENKSY